MSADDLITVIYHDGDAYRQLLSGSILLEFARGRWAMDAPDLPDSYREIHWFAVVCVTALAWLLEQGPQGDTGSLQWVLEDLVHANQNGQAAFAPLARHIQLHGRDSGVKVVEVFFPSMTEAAFRLSCQSITNVLQIIGDSPTIARAVEQWRAIYAILAPELAADRSALSMLVEGIGRELVRAADRPNLEEVEGKTLAPPTTRQPRSPLNDCDQAIVKVLRSSTRSLSKKEIADLTNYAEGYVLKRLTHLREMGLADWGEERNTYKATASQGPVV